MDLQHLIRKIETKNNQAKAYCGFLNNNGIPYEEMQELIDEYCNNMANNFILDTKEVLRDKLMMENLIKHLKSIGANNKHSGYRFAEVLYKKLNNFDQIIAENKEEEQGK